MMEQIINNYGISVESRVKLSNSLINYFKYNLHHLNKPILQYDLQGNFIKEWEYVKQAVDHLNINRRAISAACVGKAKTSGGFIWKHKTIKAE